MKDVIALGVVDGGLADDAQGDELTAEQKAVARDIAEKAVAAQAKGKEFYLEQQKELDCQSVEACEAMSKETKFKFSALVKEEMRAIDERETDAENLAYLETMEKHQPVKERIYKLAKKLESTIDENDEDIIPKTRKEYVFWFKAQQRKSARATLEMCRTTYEASRMLRESDFATFCLDVGYKDDSSTIRKFLAIGKVYPRLIDYAEKLPVAWTSIYMLTQIPADDFERCIKEGFAFDRLTGSELKELVNKTRDVNKLTSPFRQDKKQLAYPVAKVFFKKLPDDMDYRLLQKALEEVQARLPVKFQFIGEQSKMFAERTQQRYEQVKQEGDMAAVRPSEWDFGAAANEVFPTEQTSLG